MKPHDYIQLRPGTHVKLFQTPLQGRDWVGIWTYPDQREGIVGYWQPHETGIIVSGDLVGFHMILVLVCEKLGYVSYSCARPL